MSLGTRRSDEVRTALGAVAIADLETGAGEVGEGRTAVVVRVADDVGGADRDAVGAVKGTVALALAAPGAPPAAPAPPVPAQPATTNGMTAAPATERAAYHRRCLIRTHASEPSKLDGAAFGMMAW